MNTETGTVYHGAEVDAAVSRGEPLVDLPCKPLPECPRCRGKGSLKSWGTPWAFGACPVCYPQHPNKARSFKAYLASGCVPIKQDYPRPDKDGAL